MLTCSKVGCAELHLALSVITLVFELLLLRIAVARELHATQSLLLLSVQELLAADFAIGRHHEEVTLVEARLQVQLAAGQPAAVHCSQVAIVLQLRADGFVTGDYPPETVVSSVFHQLRLLC